MELKTLKDMPHIVLPKDAKEVLVVDQTIDNITFLSETLLKREAIKRIKFFLRKIGGIKLININHSKDNLAYPFGITTWHTDRGLKPYDEFIQGRIEELIDVFNITEEDLSEEFCACGNQKDSDEEVCKECK